MLAGDDSSFPRSPEPMHETLADAEMDALLDRQMYGHLGCTLPDGRVYVVPVTFAYRDGAVYGFSFPGTKVEALRANPDACLQVEEVLRGGDWKSVIVWGTYEELKGDERLHALKLLLARLELEQGTAVSALYRAPLLLDGGASPAGQDGAIFYRIRIRTRTGAIVRAE